MYTVYCIFYTAHRPSGYTDRSRALDSGQSWFPCFPYTLYCPVHNTLYYPVHNTLYYQVHNTMYYPVHNTLTTQCTTQYYPVHNTLLYPVHNTLYYTVHTILYYTVHNTLYYTVDREMSLPVWRMWSCNWSQLLITPGYKYVYPLYRQATVDTRARMGAVLIPPITGSSPLHKHRESQICISYSWRHTRWFCLLDPPLNFLARIPGKY